MSANTRGLETQMELLFQVGGIQARGNYCPFASEASVKRLKTRFFLFKLQR